MAINNSTPNSIPDISELRDKLDALDTELVTVLSKRLALIPSVAEYKRANKVERYQPKREEEVIAKRRALAEDLGVNPDLVEDLMKRIIEDAHRIEKDIMGN